MLQSTNTPNNLQQVIRTTSGKRLGMNSDFKPGLQKTNSFNLAKLMESLLDFDHEMICFRELLKAHRYSSPRSDVSMSNTFNERLL